VETKKPIKLIRGDEYTFPNVPSESCHVAVNGVIVGRLEDCPHGQLGDVWKPESLGKFTVTESDEKSVTIDFGGRGEE
jgi:hypothetical protein